ncbi:hypothetical protein [Thauera aminoaromatica]|uniref:Uncharacterized protein n=1 Tax=Thauera aminoaromatica TaxID=164330 RepID=C4KD40_THASP|nr:hypothetical protein [Thauera aminoaromatica]ACR02451.1 hypothetical protein Tmz1t_3862 [Thauera aminoaromatica]
MSLSGTQIASLVLCWLAYAALHSLLASLRLKRVVAAHWPRLAPAYRLGVCAAELQSVFSSRMIGEPRGAARD